MPEENNHKDPLEELFREKAEEYDISYNETDWLRLEKRLDAQERQRVRQRKRVWIAAASILLFALLGYFTYENYQAINRLNQQLTEEATTPTQGSEVPDNLSADESGGSREGPPSHNESTPNPPLAAADSVGNDQREEHIPSQPSLDGPVAKKRETSESSTSEADENTHFAISASATGNLYVENLSCSGCIIAPFHLESLAPPRFLIARSNRNKDKQPAAAVPETSRGAIAARASTPLAIGFVAGPDLSTVGGFSHFSNPGYKLGIAVEYRITDNLALSTGIGQANVHYTARGNEYKPPSGYWTNGIIADETTAECAILEIPVDLKYDILHFDRSRIYASAGLSSYIMLNEEYRFEYYRSENGLKQNWSGKTGTRHWLSNASFSVGYELDIMENWSLRAAPFVKVPLKEVGWGNVKLYSVGTSFSINYSIR